MKKWEKFTRYEIEEFVKESYSFATLAEKLGYNKTGGSYLTSMKKMIDELNLDISHFTGQGWLSGQTCESGKYLPFDEYIKGRSVQTNKIRIKLLREGLKEHMCEFCNNTLWNNMPIPLEVHHKDGDKENNDIENLQLLCPNCHALTDNYKGKNTRKHKLKNLMQEHQDGKPLE